MEYQHKLLLVAGLLVAFALYVVYTSQPAVPPSTSEAEALLLKSVQYGKGLGNYVYVYTEATNGYTTEYKLTKYGDSRQVEVKNPLSTKKIYITPNDTILCIAYPVNETCSSVKESSEMTNYLNFIRALFFNDTNINRNKANIDYLLSSKYMHLDPEIVNASVGGHECSKITYNIDYTNLTLADAARFGIGSNTPRLFLLSRCIDPQNGMAYETTLRYVDNKGMDQNTVTTVSSIRLDNIPAVEAPSELALAWNAVSVFKKEREQQAKIATCYTTKTGSELDICVAAVALDLKRKDLCELSGSRRDRCLVSVVPLTKDIEICPSITSEMFRDDCYIELAFAYKNETYCSSIQNSSKIPTCQNATIAGAGQKENKTEVDIDRMLAAVEAAGTNSTSTTPANQSG